MASTTSTPPYPSAARISDSPCYPQYAASLKCKATLLNHLPFMYIYPSLSGFPERVPFFLKFESCQKVMIFISRIAFFDTCL